MELAAVGVSIAIFNQVSRITIFPLVSVTTSLVAEEDTMGRLTVEAHEEEKLEKGFAISEEMKELIPEVGMLSLFFCTKLNERQPKLCVDCLLFKSPMSAKFFF